MLEFISVFLLILIGSLIVSSLIVFALIAIEMKNDKYYNIDDLPDEPITCYVKGRRK